MGGRRHNRHSIFISSGGLAVTREHGFLAPHPHRCVDTAATDKSQGICDYPDTEKPQPYPPPNLYGVWSHRPKTFRLLHGFPNSGVFPHSNWSKLYILHIFKDDAGRNQKSFSAVLKQPMPDVNPLFIVSCVGRYSWEKYSCLLNMLNIKRIVSVLRSGGL